MAWLVKHTVNPPYYAHILNDDAYPANGVMLGLTSGVAIDPDCTGKKDYRLYRSGASEKPRKKMPDIIGQAGIFYIFETFRELVGEMEPGRHQFFPYLLRNGKRGKPVEKPYYIMNFNNQKYSIILSEWRKKKTFIPPSKYLPESATVRFNIHIREDDMYTLRREDFSRFHLWWETNILNGFFVSEQVMERFDALKLKKLERVHCLEE